MLTCLEIENLIKKLGRGDSQLDIYQVANRHSDYINGLVGYFPTRFYRFVCQSDLILSYTCPLLKPDLRRRGTLPLWWSSQNMSPL